MAEDISIQMSCKDAYLEYIKNPYKSLKKKRQDYTIEKKWQGIWEDTS